MLKLIVHWLIRLESNNIKTKDSIIHFDNKNKLIKNWRNNQRDNSWPAMNSMNKIEICKEKVNNKPSKTK